MSLLDNLYNCWQFKDSLDGVAGQPFVIATPAYETGKFSGNGLRCNGAVASTGVAPGTATIPISGDWAGALWFKPASLPPSRTVVLISNVFNQIAGFRLRLNSSGKVSVNMVNSAGGNTTDILSDAVALDAWHLALFGYNSITDKAFLRVDDVNTESVNAFQISSGTPANLAIGNYPLMNEAPLNAVVSLLALWTGRILTEPEMDSLWAEGDGLDYPFA